jgi:hypothetical protein
MLATGFGVLVAVIGTFFVRRIHLDVDENIDFHFTSMERVFGVLMLITNEINHDKNILLITRVLSAAIPLAKPTPKTAPTNT